MAQTTTLLHKASAVTLAPALISPPKRFSVVPFWFWNDDLSPSGIVEQIADFERHGVYGFVIHPRVGLPRDLSWMSDKLLGFYKLAIEEAKRRGMVVTLYDEGMYPSGSSCGQVVAQNPDFRCRGLVYRELTDGQPVALAANETLVAVVARSSGGQLAVVDTPSRSHIRGLHYTNDKGGEDRPPAADLLNPLAVQAFISLVYQRFFDHFGNDFGNTIVSIFTDEPSLLAKGKANKSGFVAGTTGILAHINRILGYDFTPHLPALWFDDEPDAAKFRKDYTRAVNQRLQETYYIPIYQWCKAHGLALTGHPYRPDDMSVLRWFHIPGQDLVWRKVLPDQPSALEGDESTQAKNTASVMVHYGRQRNASECYGAYGHELTWDEMLWLAKWAFVRGVNLLHPHAFYYSVRGIRRDERPPDVGPNSVWWQHYGHYALMCQRLSWLNTDALQVCQLAILGDADSLPWRSAKVCFQQQRDFNYVSPVDILKHASVDDTGLHVGGMTYQAVIMESTPAPKVLAKLRPLSTSGRLITYHEGMTASALLASLNDLAIVDVQVSPATPALRVRHIIKDNSHYYILFNEEQLPITVNIAIGMANNRILYKPYTGANSYLSAHAPISLAGHEIAVQVVN